ncbi:response regulator [Thalassovita sp.]|uniref:response regulator n=1 Tax=Thalassovita sp. TaxID=1979401 RepID=UPI002AB31724|nr:response regulator [Thalassovita sp.]
MPKFVTRFTALVLDDDEQVLEEISEVISIIGGVVSAFNNPTECLNYLEKNPSDYDLVIVDLAMPTINGVEFLKKASELLSSSTRKFLITGLAELDGKKIEETSDLTVLLKPVSLSKLKKKIGSTILHDTT